MSDISHRPSLITHTSFEANGTVINTNSYSTLFVAAGTIGQPTQVITKITGYFFFSGTNAQAVNYLAALRTAGNINTGFAFSGLGFGYIKGVNLTNGTNGRATDAISSAYSNQQGVYVSTQSTGSLTISVKDLIIPAGYTLELYNAGGSSVAVYYDFVKIVDNY